MKSMLPEERLTRLLTALLLIFSVFSGGIASAAQTKKPVKKAPAKKAAPAKTTAKKPSSKAVASKNAKSTAQKKTPQKKAPAKKMTAAERRKEAARKKAAEEKRQAALAAQRRREQAAREARARKIAFERGLRSDTVANILKDNTEGEDLRIRRVAVEALGERAGTILVMDARTGRILTMVNQEWGVKHGFKPCSTIKLVTGVAGINENLISGDGSIIGDTMKLDLNDALAYSNNAYFQRVGRQMGTDKMIQYAKQMGLGQKTGVNAEGEFPGKLPYGNSNPRIYSHADDFEVTPLQLAVMVTALTNGGTRVTPFFSRSRTEKAAYRPGAGKEMAFDGETRRGVIPGMIGAAEYGTARRGVDSSWGVAGKTGSCISKGSWVGLFASVAPVENPEYSVVVITRGQNERGRIAAGIAAQIYQSLAPAIERDNTRFLALKQGVPPRPRLSDSVADILDDEEDDVDDTAIADVEIAEEASPAAARPAAATDDGRRVVVVGTQSRPTNLPVTQPRPTVTRTSQSKPAFPPVVIEYKKDSDPAPASTPAARPRVVPQAEPNPDR